MAPDLSPAEEIQIYSKVFPDLDRENEPSKKFREAMESLLQIISEGELHVYGRRALLSYTGASGLELTMGDYPVSPEQFTISVKSERIEQIQHLPKFPKCYILFKEPVFIALSTRTQEYMISHVDENCGLNPKNSNDRGLCKDDPVYNLLWNNPCTVWGFSDIEVDIANHEKPKKELAPNRQKREYKEYGYEILKKIDTGEIESEPGAKQRAGTLQEKFKEEYDKIYSERTFLNWRRDFDREKKATLENNLYFPPINSTHIGLATQPEV
jgi:hypothetical protein